MPTFTILHISDLHVNKENNFDRSVVLDPLIKRVREDCKNGLKPEIIVVTGDVASKGISAEYELAKAFFNDLLDAVELKNDRLFIVPGNHDLNRKKYRPTDVPTYKEMKALNDELENEEFREDLLKGMNEYFNFVKKNYLHLAPLENRLVPFVATYPLKDTGKKIGLVGLNSAWMCRGKSEKEKNDIDIGRIAIGECQIKTAMNRLKKMGKCDLVINIFHHPPQWLWQKDREIIRTYFNNSILLCGHMHRAEGGYHQDLDGHFVQLQTGACYLGSDSAIPVRFQYVAVNPETKEVRLDFRRFYPEKRKWGVDGETGDDGKKILFIGSVEKPGIAKTSSAPAEMSESYINWISSNYGVMDVEKLYGKGDAFPLKLPEVFIHLYAYEPGRTNVRKKELPGEEKQEPVNIEALIDKMNLLLIEGHAGSGKTTLLKHVAYCLVRKDNKSCQMSDAGDRLPVLVLLKELNTFFKDLSPENKKAPDAMDILDWYITNKTGGSLKFDSAKSFLENKKAVILLDGLDELLPEYRDRAVDAFVDLGIKYGGNRIVFTGRPHSMEGAAIKRLGDKHIRILSLNPGQVKEYVDIWFAYLYPGKGGIGEKNAQAMISEIKTHPAIEQLIDNPLMLTAICILYHDEKELPGQRAELYKKFIDNMLYRRFRDSENVHAFLKKLAFEMQARKVRGVDRSFALNILQEIYEKEEGEKDTVYRKRIEEIFNDIEPKCGLLKPEDGQYTFWHLTFQEFLTAQYLVDISTDYKGAIAQYWEDDWYKEVIELFIGYLSMENRSWAWSIIKDALEEDEFPYKKSLLAAEALVDMQKKRRDAEIEKKTRERLWEIIDRVEDPQIFVHAGDIVGWLGDVRDLKEFVRIEGGEYELEELGEVNMEPFEIGKYPVVNLWFEEFIKAGGYKNKTYWSPEGIKWLSHTKTEKPIYWDDRKWRCPNSPVVGISWYEAFAFTKWLTATMKDGYTYRLLTENEWQAAAAGKEGRKYPWGNKWDKNKCNNGELKIEKNSPVGVFRQGNTPKNVLDLSGNVWEWTMSDYNSKADLTDFIFDDEKSQKWPVLRGGSWGNGADYCRCAGRYWFNPDFRSYFIGFRCARTVTI